MKRVVIFDVLGTLFSLDAVRAKLTAAGAPPSALEAWFERTLHGALTLTTVGEFRPFREVERAALQTTLAQLELDVAQAEEILAGLSEVQPHDDAAAAVDRLAGADARIVALTNSGSQQTEEIQQAKLRDRFEQVFGVSNVGAYKPDRRPYEHVVCELGVAAGEAVLVAAHAWAVVGARAAGLDAIGLDRLEPRWPLPVPEPLRARRGRAPARRRLADARRPRAQLRGWRRGHARRGRVQSPSRRRSDRAPARPGRACSGRRSSFAATAARRGSGGTSAGGAKRVGVSVAGARPRRSRRGAPASPRRRRRSG